jgi:DNA-binding protein YbaB
MFDKMKQLYDMQKQAKQMQKSVEALKIETSAAGGDVKVVMNGAFKVEFISIADKMQKLQATHELDVMFQMKLKTKEG